MFSKTLDGGLTWSSPAVIVNVPSRQQTIGNQIVVNSQNGTLYDFFDLISPPFTKAAGKVAFIKSTDDGATWTEPQVISGLQTVPVTDPNTGEPVRTGDIIPEPAIDPATGQLYVVWQDSRFNGGQYDEIALSTSTDGGQTWSAPVRVNTPKGRPAFNPGVRVNSTGTVAVTYYDFRNLLAGNTSTLPTDYWQTTSTDGGNSFGNELHLAGSFDLRTAPKMRRDSSSGIMKGWTREGRHPYRSSCKRTREIHPIGRMYLPRRSSRRSVDDRVAAQRFLDGQPKSCVQAGFPL